MSPLQWQRIIQFMQQRLKGLVAVVGQLPKPPKAAQPPSQSYVG
jgi:hypothetical protein